jgi:ribosomal protein L11 methyltransferase
VRVSVPLGWHELVAGALEIGPCTTVAFGRTSVGSEPAPDGCDYVRTFLPRNADTPAERARIRAALEALAERAAVPELARLVIEFKELPAEDYARSWRKSWKPFRVGRLAVLPSWRPGPPPRATDLRLTLEPGGAFGSGRHATTRICLRVLQERLRGGERVLDAGSGSGILSVAAALLGARSVFGFDIDPTSVPYGAALAVDNGVAGACRFREGGFEVLGTDDAGFDVVLANIYSDVIQQHAADLAARLAPRGWFAFSGCPAHHVEATLGALPGAGLAVTEHRVRGRWHTFVGERRR